jgi:arylsulfatase
MTFDKHGTLWVLVERKTVPLDDDVWELYDTSKDWSQANDLAKQMPEKLHRLWSIEATRYNVLPIDDRVVEKMNPDTAGRPVLIKGNTQLLFGGMGRLSENCVLNTKNKSHSVTAEIVVPEKGAGEKVGEGVIPMTRAISLPTTAVTSARTAARQSRRITARATMLLTGRSRGVQLAIGEAAESSDHLVSPEEAIHIAMARQ